jgi:hypothetical protein
MWPFSRGKKAAEVEDLPSTAARRLEDVESQVRMLKTEWLDALDRFDRLAGRITKREERAEKGGGGEAPGSPPRSNAAASRLPLTATQRIAIRRRQL